MDNLPFRSASVVGLGRTGRATAVELARRGVRVFVTEQRTLKERERALLARHGVRWEEGAHSGEALNADLLVVSPGVPPRGSLVANARARGLPVWSELELAYRLAFPDKLLAITGTNGKSTTTVLVGSILRAAGLRPVVAGNIGRPAVRSVERCRQRPWVLEVSSYQLELVERFRPHVAVWLNLAPDHLARHSTLAGYFAAKARVLARQRACDVAVLPRELLSCVAPKSRVELIGTRRLPDSWRTDLPPHQLVNVTAAWAASVAAYPHIADEPPSWEAVEHVLYQPHRLERVGCCRGILFVNDSKATNAHSTLAALGSFAGPVVLILGGRAKEGGYEVLGPVLRQRARSCVVIGESRKVFAELLEAWGVPYVVAEGPDEALTRAYALAQRGDVVLLSPACASFDMFKDYVHRGRAFRRAFHRLRGAWGEANRR